jgi:hypothetical protein
MAAGQRALDYLAQGLTNRWAANTLQERLQQFGSALPDFPVLEHLDNLVGMTADGDASLPQRMKAASSMDQLYVGLHSSLEATIADYSLAKRQAEARARGVSLNIQPNPGRPKYEAILGFERAYALGLIEDQLGGIKGAAAKMLLGSKGIDLETVKSQLGALFTDARDLYALLETRAAQKNQVIINKQYTLTIFENKDAHKAWAIKYLSTIGTVFDRLIYLSAQLSKASGLLEPIVAKELQKQGIRASPVYSALPDDIRRLKGRLVKDEKAPGGRLFTLCESWLINNVYK